MIKTEQQLLDLAEAHLVGFILGSRGFSIRELISLMDLKKEEWNILKNKIYLIDTEKEEIEKYFMLN